MHLPHARCLKCNLPLEETRRAALLARLPVVDMALCASCGLRVPCAPPPALGSRESPTQRRLFVIEPENKSGVVITCDPARNKAQVIVWDAHFVKRTVWQMSYRDLLDTVLLLSPDPRLEARIAKWGRRRPRE